MRPHAACRLWSMTPSADERIDGNGLTYVLNDQAALQGVAGRIVGSQARKALGEAGARRMAQLFSWDALVRRRILDYVPRTGVPAAEAPVVIRATLSVLDQGSPAGGVTATCASGRAAESISGSLRQRSENSLQIGASSMFACPVCFTSDRSRRLRSAHAHLSASDSCRSRSAWRLATMS